jgi:hypothetical protein
VRVGVRYGMARTPTFIKPCSFYTHLPAYEDGTECSETSVFKIQTPGNYPEEIIQQNLIHFTALFIRPSNIASKRRVKLSIIFVRELKEV